MVDYLTIGALAFVALLIIGFIIYAINRDKKMAATYKRVAQERMGEYVGAEGNAGGIRIPQEHNFKLGLNNVRVPGTGGRETSMFTLLTMDIDPSVYVDIKKKLLGAGVTMNIDTQKIYETLPEQSRAAVYDIVGLSYIKAEKGVFEIRIASWMTKYEELMQIIDVSLKLRDEFERVFKRS